MCCFHFKQSTPAPAHWHFIPTAGLKQGLGKLRRYLFITTDDTSPDGASSSQLHLLDVRNKLLAGSFSVQGLAAVVVGPGGLATWDKSGRLMRYFEVELNTQVQRRVMRYVTYCMLLLMFIAGRQHNYPKRHNLLRNHISPGGPSHQYVRAKEYSAASQSPNVMFLLHECATES
jgi:hypothetical protein